MQKFQVVVMIRLDPSMADQEIDDDQRAIELEIVGIANGFQNPFDRPEVKFVDFPIGVARLEVGRQFKVVDIQHVAPETLLGLGHVADRAGGDSFSGQGGENAGLFAAFLYEIVAERQAGGLPPATS